MVGKKDMHEDYPIYICCICRTVFLFLFCHCFVLKWSCVFHLCLVSVLLHVHSYLKCSFAKTFYFSFGYFEGEGWSLEIEQWTKWLNHLWPPKLPDSSSSVSLIETLLLSKFPPAKKCCLFQYGKFTWSRLSTCGPCMDSKTYTSDLYLALELFSHACTTLISCPATSELHATG